MSNVELHASLLKHGEDEDDVSITATDLEKNSHELSRYQTTTKTTPYLWIILPWCLLLVLSMWLLFQQYYREPVQVSVSRLLYSPAQDALGYEIKKFRLGLHDDITEYQGDPTPELDERWESLYKMGISAIPLEMARQLPNRTAMIPHDTQKRYIIQLDVFHQLHCLNAIRKALHPVYYNVSSQADPNNDGGILEPHHIDHCVDAIRQSLMCNADVTPLTWLWDEERRQTTAKATVVHSCRRFDKIQEWAEQYNYPKLMDRSHRAVDDPLDPETWVDGFPA